MTKVTPKKEWHAEFIAAFVKSRSVTRACKAVGKSRAYVYRCRREDPDFGRMWADAKLQNRDDLEGSALQRAIDGWEEPVFYEGSECGKKRRFSTSLTIFMLKALHPERYHLEKKALAELPKGTGVLAAPAGVSIEAWVAAVKSHNEAAAKERADASKGEASGQGDPDA